MNLFQKIFQRNKNAHTTPRMIQDSRSAIDIETEIDATSFSCIDKIATAFASLSYGVYDSKTKQKTNHPIYDVLKEPNLDETHSLFFYEIVKDYYDGNVYLYKYTDDNGNVTSLFRLNPNAVYVTRNEYNQKIYTYYGNRFDSTKILHIPSRFGYDGKIGHSIFRECKKIFDTAVNLDTYTNNTFDNSMGKRLVIDISDAYPDATDDEKMQIRQKYINNYGGVENAGKPIVKNGKIEFSTIDTGVSDNRSSQLSENREFQQAVISQMFNIPIEYLKGSGTTDIETLTTIFMSQAILPIANAFEESFNKLFSPADRERYYIEFNYNSILRTSLNSKIDAYTKQLNNGMLSPNEIRAKENESPITAGDYHFIPANLMPLTDENVKAYMAQSKVAIAEQQKTSVGIGNDKR